MGRKQLYGYFEGQTSEILHAKTWRWLKRGDLNRETESLLIAAQNSAIRIYYVKAKLDKTQQNNICNLCEDRDETIGHIISKGSKLVPKKY